jgi:transposase InsO family protein
LKGQFFYWYMMKDVYSRLLVANEVHESESAELAASLLTRGCLREGLAGRPLVLHSDNGSAMKGSTMLAAMQNLGVMPSFSRPRVSNDNAHAETLFRTAKYFRYGRTSHSNRWRMPEYGFSASFSGTTRNIDTAGSST